MITVSQFLKRDNNNLDFIRIICAIMVIYGHAFFLANKGPHRDIFTQMFSFTYAGAIAVKVFFFISGMLVTTSLLRTRSASAFLTARALRIFPAFIVTVCLSALLIGPALTNISLSDYFSNSMVLSYIFKNIVMDINYFLPGVFTNSIYKPVINGSLWTIPYEIASYITLLAFFVITGMRNKTFTNVACLIIIASPVLSNGNDFITQVSNKDVYLLGPCFCFGILYAINSDNIKINISTPLSFFALFYITPNEKLSQLFFYFSICSLFVFIASIHVIRKIKIKNDISYGVYLWGFVTQQIVYKLHPDLNIYLNIIVSISISCTIAMISFIYFERPAINLSQSLRKQILLNEQLAKAP